MADLIVKGLLITALVLQIIMLVYTFIMQIRRNREDKQFWEEMGEALKEQVNRYNNLYPEAPLSLEEGNDEQDK